MRLLHLLTILCLGLAAQVAPAQEPHALPAEAGAPWTHKLTNMILPASAAGLTRREIRDLTSGELDIFAEYEDPAHQMFAMVFVYRTDVPDAAIWYERAILSLQSAPGHGLSGVAMPSPSPFARPGAGAASGLRLAMDVPGPRFKSMAVAVVPLGNWLVKVQMSSLSLDRAGIDAKLDSMLQALGWPAETAAPRAAAAILPCPKPLRTKPAKIVRDDIGQVLMNSVAFISMDREGPPAVYCRDPGVPIELGVYRADGDDNSYVIALGDAGGALSVAPAISLDSLMGEGGRARSYSMTMLDHGNTAVLPSFNRLPPPQQALSVARSSTPSITTTPPSETPN
jgi:hypothetical protein